MNLIAKQWRSQSCIWGGVQMVWSGKGGERVWQGQEELKRVWSLKDNDGVNYGLSFVALCYGQHRSTIR